MHSMKGKISMNQIVLKIKLCAESDDKDILLFEFPDNPLKVNLNSDSCQEELKAVFSQLINTSLDNDVTLAYEIEDGYSRTLYKEVCNEYVVALQNELNSIIERIRNEL